MKYLFLFLLLASCKKETYSVYTVASKTQPHTYDCYYVARSGVEKPELKFYAPCDKYKIGDTFKVQL